MNALNTMFGRLGAGGAGQYKMLAGPILILMIMAMMILPLPPLSWPQRPAQRTRAR